MKALLDLFERGGPAMFAIVGLSVVLYTRCFHLLLWLRRENRLLRAIPVMPPGQLAALHRRQQQVQETFRQQRIALAAMIAAAPLLGLLGTVSGLVRTFESLADHVGQKSMEGLAQGISEVLVATESGLAVALPALLFVYLTHRAVQRNRQRLNRLETAGLKEPLA
jgi:biopolymer transport protein ExbB